MPARRSNWSGIALGLGLACFAAYQQFKLPPALPVLLEAYGYERTLAGAFMSVYALAGLLLSLPLGRLAERRGAYAPVMGAFALMLLGGALALAVPESGAVMFAGRAVEGIAAAALAIVGPVLAQRHAAARHLPLVIGLTAAWIPVGQLSAVLLAPAALAAGGWPALWLIGLALTAALAGLVQRLHSGGRVALGPRRPPPAGAAAEAQAPGLTARERTSVALAAAVFMLWTCQYFAFMTWLPQLLVEVHGLGITGALWGYALPVAFVLAFTVVGGALLRAGVPIAPLFAGAMAAQAAVWWVLPSASGAGGLAALAVYGAAGGIVPTCLFAMPSAIVGAERGMARTFGVIMTGRNVGVLAGPVLLAQVFSATGGWEAGGPLLGGLTAAALVLTLVLAARLRGVAYGTSR